MLDMFESEQLNANSISTYQAYPLNKPFINTDWNLNRNETQLSRAFPESNRDGLFVILAKTTTKKKF